MTRLLLRLVPVAALLLAACSAQSSSAPESTSMASTGRLEPTAVASTGALEPTLEPAPAVVAAP